MMRNFWSRAQVTAGTAVAFPIRLLLVMHVLHASTEQRSAFLTPDDPTKPGYRTPSLDLEAGSVDVRGLERTGVRGLSDDDARAVTFLRGLANESSDVSPPPVQGL
jgi:hypothetical protein